MRIALLALIHASFLVAACGPGAAPRAAEPPGSESDVGSPDAAGPPSRDGSTSIDWAAACTKIAASVSGCAPGFHAECVQAFAAAEVRGCGAWLPLLHGWIADSARPYACMPWPGLGTVPTISADAPELAVVGDACAGAVNRAPCYTISCKTSLDCPQGQGCNDATGHCFSQTSSCAGLPCKTSLDCPQGETCNDALGVCIRS